MKKNFEPSISIPNNIAPKHYPQDFVYSNDFPKAPKSQNLNAPSLGEVMADFTSYKPRV